MSENDKYAKLKEITKGLQGISLTEWDKIKTMVDGYFRLKKGELERQLKLEDVNMAIDIFLSQFVG